MEKEEAQEFHSFPAKAAEAEVREEEKGHSISTFRRSTIGHRRELGSNHLNSKVKRYSWRSNGTKDGEAKSLL